MISELYINSFYLKLYLTLKFIPTALVHSLLVENNVLTIMPLIKFLMQGTLHYNGSDVDIFYLNITILVFCAIKTVERTVLHRQHDIISVHLCATF